MALSLKIQGGIILLWLFILSTRVSSYGNECWSFLCITDPSLNCTCKPEMPNWLVPTICLVPLIIIATCCIRLCIHYYNERDNILLQDVPYVHSPPLIPMPDVVSAPNFEVRIPPSYDEAVGKQQCCPVPLEDPPAYEDIAMHCTSPVDVSIFLAIMPNDSTTSV